MKRLLILSLCVITLNVNLFAQAPGCPNIVAPADIVLPCTQACTTLTATPFHVGATTTYTVGATSATPVIPYNQAGGTAIVVGGDDVYSGVINLPFPFCYYGNTYTQCVVGSNGVLTFNPGLANGYCPWFFSVDCPNAALPLNSIFGIYMDEWPGQCGQVKYHLIGTAPCRMLVVNFDNVCQYSCLTSARTNSQIVLYETTNVIEVYTNKKQSCAWNGGRAIIGIQNATGAVGMAAPGRNTTNAIWTPPAAGDGWRFTPNGAPIYNVTWWQGATQIGAGNSINVCPTASPTTYTARATYTRCDGLVINVNDDVVVTLSALTAPAITTVAETCNNYNDGTVTINNPVGAGPYTVTITGPANPPAVVEPNTVAGVATFNNLPDGTYNYLVTSANGCTVNGTFSIAAGPPCCNVTANGTNALCNGGSTGTASANPVGQAPFNYSWNSAPVQNSQTAITLPAGTYTVTMTDASGCTATASYIVTQPTALTGTLSQVNVTCNGLCNGSITVNGAGGGTGALQYSINGGPFQASNTFNGLCAGAYTVIIRDANNCTRTLNATITQPAALTLAAGSLVPATCGNPNGSVVLAAGGGTVNYQFNIGGPNQASGTFTGLAPNTYTATVTDQNGCTATTTFTIANQPGPVASIGTQSNVSCAGGVNGSVVINAVGGTGALTYDLNPGPAPQASNTFTGLGAGAYTVIVADANGCSNTVNFTITQPTQLTFTSVSQNISCNGVCDGQITVTANNATPPYQYSSNGGLTFQASNVLTGLCAGTINVVVRDANGCLSNANVILTQPAALTATYTPTNPICQGICNGQIAVATSAGGTVPYQYSVDGGALQAGTTFTGMCGGNHTMVISDANGCQVTTVVNLVDPPGYTVNTISSTSSNCGFNDGAFTVQASGGNAPYTYNNITVGISNATGIFPDLVAGAYEVVVTDALGCQEIQFIGVNDIQMNGLLLSTTDPTCPGACNGTVSTIATSGFGTISYDLDNGMQSAFGSGDFSGICDGSHAITMTDQGFCIFVVPFTLVAPPSIQFTTAVTNTLCNGGSDGIITFNAPSGGTPPYQYSVDNGVTFQAGSVFTGLAAGTYNVVVRDGNNCTQTGTATIGQPNPLIISSSHTDLTCFGNNSGTLLIVGNGGTGAIQYSNNGGATFGATFSFFGLAAGVYNIAIQDANGCIVNSTATIVEPPLLTATYATTPALCNTSCDGTIQVNANGGTAPYLYSSNNGVVFQTASLLENLCAGSYQVQVVDDNGCLVGSNQLITEPTAVAFTTAITPSTCGNPNGSIVINANGGNGTFLYSIDNGITFQVPNTFNGLAAGIYNVVVEDGNGCQEIATADVQNQSSPVINALFTTDLLCNAVCNGQLNVTATGGTGALNFDIGGATQAGGIFASLCAGNYTVTVTDANGCTASQNATITEPPVLTLASTPTDLNCFGDNSGEISLVAAGGVTPYLYSYDNGATQSSFSTQTGFAAGNYTTIVTDANGCQTTSPVVVAQPTQMTITNQNTVNASCFGVCDGEVSITISGGTTAGFYTHQWANGIGGPNQNTVLGLCAGSYSVTVVDDNACSIDALFNVTQPVAVVVSSFTATNPTCAGSCDGQLTAIGVNVVDYSIDGVNFQVSPTFTGLCSGVYTLTGRDINGCTVSLTATLTEPTPVVLDPIAPITICAGFTGVLSSQANGGTPPYNYIWNTGDDAQFYTVTALVNTTFTVTAFDLNGCPSAPQTGDVNVIPSFVPTTTGDVNVCPGSPASITASATGGVPGYIFTWLYENDTLVDSPTLTFVPSAPSTVMLVAEDGCPDIDTIYINVGFHVTPQPTATVTPSSGCAPLTVDFLNTTPAAQVGTDCSWTFGDGGANPGCGAQSHVYTTPGCYDVTLTVVSPEGCVGSQTFDDMVCVYGDPIADFTYNPSTPTIINSSINFVDASINGATYQWDFAGMGTSTQQNPTFNFVNVDTGFYQVCLTVTSPQGCVNDTCKMVYIFDEFLVYVPNAFTPDGDGINDVFMPVLTGLNPEHFELLIFNRWGEVIYQTNNPTKGWDGRSKGVMSKQDVYVWKIRTKDALLDIDKEFVGHVTLLIE
ncbi:MAG: gliding motility-associated C-terminal domain-containing protein [Flavobacteriales bacterium]